MEATIPSSQRRTVRYGGERPHVMDYPVLGAVLRVLTCVARGERLIDENALRSILVKPCEQEEPPTSSFCNSLSEMDGNVETGLHLAPKSSSVRNCALPLRPPESEILSGFCRATPVLVHGRTKSHQSSGPCISAAVQTLL